MTNRCSQPYSSCFFNIKISYYDNISFSQSPLLEHKKLETIKLSGCTVVEVNIVTLKPFYDRNCTMKSYQEIKRPSNPFKVWKLQSFIKTYDLLITPQRHLFLNFLFLSTKMQNFLISAWQRNIPYRPTKSNFDHQSPVYSEFIAIPYYSYLSYKVVFPRLVTNYPIKKARTRSDLPKRVQSKMTLR